jgi:hypothetical protein
MTAFATAARVLAIVIALAGVLDPAVMSMRATRADVALVPSHRPDTAMLKSVADRLEKHFAVVRGPWDKAAATVVVGNDVPERIPGGPLYRIPGKPAGHMIPYPPALTLFDVPPTVASDARFPVRVRWPFGRVELRANGVIVDTATVEGGSALDTTFYVTPTATGPLHLSATLTSGPQSWTTDAMTNVVDRRAAVLFHDGRPSWMSTFVRRSLEQDRRFAVASRVITSRGVSTDAGQPPSTLADPSLLELYDVIVVGAPASLTASDVAGLETFLRRRGGAVVMLYDETPKAGAADRLTGVSRWTSATSRTPVAARAADDTVALRFTESASPATLPATAERRAAIGKPIERAVVWTNAIGAGQLIVSGALDAWKFRDRATSGFDEFWRAIIARAATDAQQAAAIEIEPSILAPGERALVRITLRDTLTTPAVMIDSARLDTWPGEHAGEYLARITPGKGDHWLRATAAGAKAESPLIVLDSARRFQRNDAPTLDMVATASGGMTGDVDAVDEALRARVKAQPRLERTWPMRSGWWILPFVALLGFEWFTRRRRGLA